MVGDQVAGRGSAFEDRKKCRVLVFPCGSEPAGEIHDALRYSVHVDLVGGSSIDDHGRFRFKQYLGDLPNIADDSFLAEFAGRVLANKIDLVFSTHDSVSAFLAAHAERLPCQVVNSDAETNSIARSKRRTMAFFHGESWVPEVYQSPAHVRSWPAIVKPDIGQGGQGVVRVESPEEAAAAMLKVPDPVLVEFLPGDEITIDCFTDRHGRLLHVGPRTRERVRAGISMRTRLIDGDPDIRAIAHAINRRLRFRGPWFFQLKRSVEGRWKLLEFSCRVSGAMVAQRAHGINLPLLAVLDYQGRDVAIGQGTSIRLVDRSIQTRADLDFEFDEVFIDYDDTLIIEGRVVPTVIAFVYYMVAQGKRIVLISRHAGCLSESLASMRIDRRLFDRIIHIQDGQSKADFVTARSIFVDNHYPERQEVALRLGIPVFDVDALQFLIR